MDPELAALAPLLPVLDLTQFADTRAAIAAFAAGAGPADQPWRERVDVSDRRIPGRFGAPEVPVRIYRPRVDGNRPALVYFHGGAFVLGEVGLFDDTCAGYAEHADVVVVSVDYRLAPEHPFPAGLDDCYAALEWTAANCDDIAVDPAAIAVGGLSAGGALAAAVALMARDRDGPAIAFQLLVNAVLDDRLETVSVQAFTDTPLWNSHDVAIMWDLYLGPERRHVSPYAAPARDRPLRIAAGLRPHLRVRSSARRGHRLRPADAPSGRTGRAAQRRRRIPRLRCVPDRHLASGRGRATRRAATGAALTAVA